RKLPWQNVQRMTPDNLDELENWLFQKSTRSSPSSSLTASNLREYLESDPEGIFQTTHILNHPQATFQAIALKLIDGWSWKQISEEFNIKVPTLSSFYQRNLKKFTPQFQAYLSP
ncbi:MAG: sigma-70 family RNA polymerase sigma factor, partial [Spirulina sp.]